MEEITLTEAKRLTYILKAIQFLDKHGKVRGIDFIGDDAVDKADTLAFEQEKERQLTERDLFGGLISFDGQNCDDCAGWNGRSRRCDCGNRRVDWVTGFGHTFLHPHVYGEAY